jgi:hypothetical protein
MCWAQQNCVCISCLLPVELGKSHCFNIWSKKMLCIGEKLNVCLTAEVLLLKRRSCSAVASIRHDQYRRRWRTELNSTEPAGHRTRSCSHRQERWVAVYPIRHNVNQTQHVGFACYTMNAFLSLLWTWHRTQSLEVSSLTFFGPRHS